jgi:23S rRNA pseudouridine2605 synthase
MAAERLQKYLASAGVASRRHAEELITAGRVTVNNQKVTELGSRVEPGKDLVMVDGKLVAPPEEKSYFLLYKPTGVVTTLSDPQGRPTVASYLEETGKRLFPVGRLDYDAEGALLVTDDGELGHKLTHPSFQVPRTYLAKVKGTPDEATLMKLIGGVRLEDGMAKPLSVDIFEQAERNTWLKLVVAEGRPHLIKRLCAAVGHPVVRLYRPSYAGVSVGSLRPGQLRPLSEAEVHLLEAVAEGRTTPSERDLKLPPRRHGRSAPGFSDDGDDFDEAPEPERAAPRTARAGKTAERSERPARKTFGDRAERSERPARKSFGERPERGERPARKAFGERPVRKSFGDRPERGERPARKTFGDRPERGEQGARPERREWKPAGGGERPVRKTFGDRPERKSFGDRPERGERPVRKTFGERPERKPFGDRPERKSFGDRPERGERPVRKTFGERPERKPFGDRPEGGERPARKTFGERPERKSFGERPERGERPARKTFGERPERKSFGDRPERKSFGDRPERGERPARKTFGDRPARKTFGDRPARPSFGDRPERGERSARPERREGKPAGGGERPARKSFGERPMRGEGSPRMAGRPERGGGGDRPVRRASSPAGEGAPRGPRSSEEGGRPPARREARPPAEGGAGGARPFTRWGDRKKAPGPAWDSQRPQGRGGPRGGGPRKGR